MKNLILKFMRISRQDSLLLLNGQEVKIKN